VRRRRASSRVLKLVDQHGRVVVFWLVAFLPRTRPPHRLMNVLPNNTTCNKCAATNTQRVAMAYSSGTSNAKLTGLTFSEGDSFGVVSGKSTSQTLLARQLRPPTGPSYIFNTAVAAFGAIGAGVLMFLSFAICFGNVGYSFLAAFFGAIMVAGVAFWQLDKNFKSQEAKYKRELWRWQNSWVCLRCGNTWMPRASDAVKLAA
jgi:hypothetical protein